MKPTLGGRNLDVQNLDVQTIGLWTRALQGEPLSGGDAQQLLAAFEDVSGPWCELMQDRRMDGILRVLHTVAQLSEQERFAAAVLARQALEDDADQFVPAVQRRLEDAARSVSPARRSRRELVLAFLAGAMCATGVALWVGGADSKTHEELLGKNHKHGRALQPAGPDGGTILPGTSTATEPAHAAHFHPVDAVVAELQGPVIVVGTDGRRRARIGMPLSLHDSVVTDLRSRAVVRFADRTRVELGRNTEVRALGSAPSESRVASERRIVIERGSVTASVTPHSVGIDATTFVTQQAVVRVVGTELALRVSPVDTRVIVEEGVVRVRRGTHGTDVEMVAGQWTVVGAKQVPVLQRSRGAILLVTGDLVLNEGEEQMRDRLETMGWSVVVMRHGEATAQNGEGKALVIISNTTESTELDLGFRDLQVPIVSCEPWFYDELGMTWANDGNRHMNQTSLLVHSKHPLAAGLSGVVRVSHAAFSLVWGRPGPGAQWVASAVDNPSIAPIFGYERGAAMQGIVAPARRVGFFLAEDSAATLTDAGWQLFDAAVKWSVGL